MMVASWQSRLHAGKHFVRLCILGSNFTEVNFAFYPLVVDKLSASKAPRVDGIVYPYSKFYALCLY